MERKLHLTVVMRGKDMARKDTQGMEVLIAVYSTQAADSICSQLAANQLHYLRRKIGSGDNGNFLMSLRNFGEEVLVDSSEMERAMQIRDEWIKTIDNYKNDNNSSGKVAQIPGENKGTILAARVISALVIAAMVIWYVVKNQ